MAADEAIILAGGFGTRLRDVVVDVPKPLAPVAGRPFLAWLLDRLAAQGMRRCILATGYMADVVEHDIGTRWAGMDIVHSVETTPLGTGGAIRQAATLLHGAAVHVLNGDTWLAYSPVALERATGDAGAIVGVALAHVDDVGRYGAADTRSGIVTGFREKGDVGDGWINAGCYFLTAEAIAGLPGTETFSFESEVLLPMSAAGKVAAWTDTGDFIDIGVPEDYLRARQPVRSRMTVIAIRPPYLDPQADAMLASASTPRRALLLDRDGVINVNHGYVHSADGTQWLPGIFELVEQAHRSGFVVIMVTNQAGIGRGYYSEQDFLAYTAWMHAQFAQRGTPLLATFWCPHHPQEGAGDYRVACECRKPQPGMLLAAAARFGLDMQASWMVGDKDSDMQAAAAAGVGHCHLLEHGDGLSCITRSLLAIAAGA